MHRGYLLASCMKRERSCHRSYTAGTGKKQKNAPYGAALGLPALHLQPRLPELPWITVVVHVRIRY